MKQTIDKRQKTRRSIRQQMMLAGGLILFSFLTLPSVQAAPASEPTSWMATGGAILMQHSGGLSALGLQAFQENSAAAQWTNIPEHAGEWNAVAMDGRRILFFYEPGSELAICTLDENGAPIEWLPLDRPIRKYTPVALEGNRILIQRGPRGKLGEIQFDTEGHIVSETLLWKKSKGWAVRGMDANRIVLEHTRTGDVAIWAANPKAPLFRPYNSFTLTPGWSVRDFAGDFILIQEGESGAMKLIELGDEYQAKQTTDLTSSNEGWHAVALTQE